MGVKISGCLFGQGACSCMQRPMRGASGLGSASGGIRVFGSFCAVVGGGVAVLTPIDPHFLISRII